VSLQEPEDWDFPAVSVVSGQGFSAITFLAWGIVKNSLGSRQIVLVFTGEFSVLNKEIFCQESRKKASFTMHPD